MKKILPAIVAILFSMLWMTSSAYACGCGLALSEPKIFNALKETQAYLLIDVEDETTYNEMPFFRMVSMDEPYDVTIVFPIDGVPQNVEGEKITASEFLRKYKVGNAEEAITEQNFSELLKKAEQEMKQSSQYPFMFSNGLFAGVVAYQVLNSIMGGVTMDDSQVFGIDAPEGIAPIAHFEFEGGSLDIYDVDSMNTLEEFVEKIQLELTGELAELVTKYKDYYAAVLYLKVPSAISRESMLSLKQCPEEFEKVKKALQEKTEFSDYELYDLTKGKCEKFSKKLVNSVINSDTDLEGTLVKMKFAGTNEFFYPTSLVNSYKYPITDEKYFIQTPKNLNIKLSSSRISDKASFNDERWYKVGSTEEDIKGQIIKAGTGIRMQDFLRTINGVAYRKASGFVLLLYLLITAIPLLYYRYRIQEELTVQQKIFSVIFYVIGGFLLVAVVMAVRKKKKLALILFVIWLAYLLLWVLF